VFELQLAGFDFGDIQDVVDDGEQMLARSVDLAKPLGLRRADFPAQQVSKAENGVHRRTDFVRHVGEKRALGLAGRFGHTPGIDQLSRAQQHLLFEMVAVAHEFGLGLTKVRSHDVEGVGECLQFVPGRTDLDRRVTALLQGDDTGLQLFERASQPPVKIGGTGEYHAERQQGEADQCRPEEREIGAPCVLRGDQREHSRAAWRKVGHDDGGMGTAQLDGLRRANPVTARRHRRCKCGRQRQSAPRHAGGQLVSGNLQLHGKSRFGKPRIKRRLAKAAAQREMTDFLADLVGQNDFPLDGHAGLGRTGFEMGALRVAMPVGEADCVFCSRAKIA